MFHVEHLAPGIPVRDLAINADAKPPEANRPHVALNFVVVSTHKSIQDRETTKWRFIRRFSAIHRRRPELRPDPSTTKEEVSYANANSRTSRAVPRRSTSAHTTEARLLVLPWRPARRGWFSRPVSQADCRVAPRRHLATSNTLIIMELISRP